MAPSSARFEGWPVVAVATLLAAVVLALTDSVFIIVLVAVGWASLVGPWVMAVFRPGGEGVGAHTAGPAPDDDTERG